MNIETVKQYYQKISIKQQLSYVFPIYKKHKKFSIFSIIFLFLFLVISIKYKVTFINIFIILLIVVIYYLMLFYFLVLPIKFYNFKHYEIHYKTLSHNIMNFNQQSYFDTYNKFKNNLKKHDFLKKIIFFVTWTGKEKEIYKKEKACFFFANYKYLEYLKKYKTHKYISNFIIKTFIITSFAFFALVLLLTNLSIDYSNQNIIFFFSVSYIIYIMSFAYATYLDREQDRYFSQYLKDFPMRFFLLSDNLDLEEEDIAKTSDALSIVFGVLFTLYVTLSFNMIYSTNVNIKDISTNKPLSIQKVKNDI